MNLNKIGIIGYGEVGQAFARGLSAAKHLSIDIFDIQFNAVDTSNDLRSLAKSQGSNIEKDIKALVANNDMILSTVTCQNALKVAEESSPHIKEGKIFVDMNTVTPNLKIEINQLIQKRGGIFIEVAILGTVASYGYKSPILACGKKASDFADFFNRLGFKVSFLSEEIGKASYMKMLRSVFAKGVESLLIEMLVAAERCDMLETVMNEIVEHMDKSSFLKIAETWITTNVIHARRRAEEMDHVIETLTNLKVKPIMASATKDRLTSSSELNILKNFKGENLRDYREVIKVMVAMDYT
jgi:3-hydroxyisobutyrate dehydrogenase-like beta-hydroxyacid dehydrogenase